MKRLKCASNFFGLYFSSFHPYIFIVPGIIYPRNLNFETRARARAGQPNQTEKELKSTETKWYEIKHISNISNQSFGKNNRLKAVIWLKLLAFFVSLIGLRSRRILKGRPIAYNTGSKLKSTDIETAECILYFRSKIKYTSTIQIFGKWRFLKEVQKHQSELLLIIQIPLFQGKEKGATGTHKVYGGVEPPTSDTG